MVSAVLVGGLLLGAFATGLVFADTVRRDLPPRTRYRWTGSAGLTRAGGFLTLYRFDDVVYRRYHEATGGPAVAPLPREVSAGLLVTGVAASAVAVLAYGFGSRYGPLKAT